MSVELKNYETSPHTVNTQDVRDEVARALKKSGIVSINSSGQLMDGVILLHRGCAPGVGVVYKYKTGNAGQVLWATKEIPGSTPMGDISPEATQ